MSREQLKMNRPTGYHRRIFRPKRGLWRCTGCKRVHDRWSGVVPYQDGRCWICHHEEKAREAAK